MIVYGLRELGIPARAMNTFDLLTGGRSVVGGHWYPWFPSLDRGLTHGDDAYRLHDRNPQELLLPRAGIERHWQSVLDAEEQEREVGGMLLWSAMGSAPTPEQEGERAAILSRVQRFRFADGELVVPAAGDLPDFRVVVREILANVPTPLLTAFVRLGGDDVSSIRTIRWIGGNLERVQSRIMGLPSREEHGQRFEEGGLPPEVRQPRLPRTRDEACREIVNAMFRYTVEEGARNFANAVVYGQSRSLE
jgi:hypothetical protein